MWKNSFDIIVMQWFNQYALASAPFNHAVNYIANSYVFKGFPILGLLWYFWFRDADSTSKTRGIVIGTVIGCVLSLLVATMINYAVPFQPRPIESAALNFHIPLGLEMDQSSPTGHEWLNSFPSHHASMFFSLAIGVFLISKRFGCLTFLNVIVMIAFPRIYLGLHSTSDITAGALLGIMITSLVNQDRIRTLYDGLWKHMLALSPAAFHHDV